MTRFGAALADPGPMPDSIVAPFHPYLCNALSANGVVNRMLMSRVTCRKTGTLHGLTVGIGGTAAGNLIGAVYDTGDAASPTRTKLWDSGSVAAGAGGVGGAVNGWQVIGDPGLHVEAGQQLDFGVIPDNATTVLLRYALLHANLAQLPANFWPAPGGAAPVLSYYSNQGSFAAPNTVPEAFTGGGAQMVLGVLWFIMARIS